MLEFIENFFKEQRKNNGEGIQPIFFDGKYIILEEENKLSLYLSRQEVIKNDINLTDKKIVDFGCNVGIDGLEFSRNGAKVTFVEIDSGMIDMVKFLAMKQELDVEIINKSYIEFLENNKQHYDIFLLFSTFSYSSLANYKDIFKSILNITEIAYIDLSPEREYQPFNIDKRKEYQQKTLYSFCKDYLGNYFYDILESEYSYIIKVSKK